MMAKLGLADVHARAGRYDRAVALYKELAGSQNADVPVDGVLMELGRAYAMAGKTADAVQTFTRIVDEFPQSPYAADAKKEIDGLKNPEKK